MKVKNIMFSGFMAMVLAGACGAANAEIIVASQKYVDDKVTTLNSKDTELSGKITALETANEAGGAVANAIAEAKQAGTNAQSAVDTLAGKMNLDSADSALSQALALKENTANKLVSGDIDLLDAKGKVDTNAMNALVGEDTKFPTVGAAVEIANAKAQQVLENVSEVSADLGTLTTTVGGHTVSIQKLEGGADVTGSVANAIKESKDYADSLVTAEENRAKGEESRIEGLVTAEKSRAEGKEAELAAAKEDKANKVTSVTAYEGLDAAAQALAYPSYTAMVDYVEDAQSDLVTSVGLNTTAIEAEKERAMGVESGLDTAVKAAQKAADDEAARAKLVEQANADAIANEKERAMGVEQGLQNAIDAINNGDTGALAQANDYTDTKVSGLETKLMHETNGTVTVAVAAEKSRAEGEEARIEGLVTAEENRAKGEEARIEGLVTAEASRADAAEKANAQAIADEKSRAELAEQGLQTAIDSINNGTNGIYAQAKAYTDGIYAQAKAYTDAGLTTIYSNASECIAASPSNNCILSARTGTDGNPMYVWISLTSPAE